VSFIELGRYKMETWYFSPYPKEYYADGVVDTVRVCACVSM
jgi:histone acetyltransferase MYST1